MFIGKYNKSVILTFLGLISSTLGICFTINNRISFAIICLITSGICDLFDGKIARMCKRDDIEKDFGVQIDSLVDVISFLALPACIYIKLIDNYFQIFNIVIIFYVSSGIIRLAWFNINSNKEDAIKYYIGLPVTYASLIIPLFYIINLILNFNFSYIYVILYVFMSVTFILNVKIKKPTGIWYGIFIFLAILFICIIIYVI